MSEHWSAKRYQDEIVNKGALGDEEFAKTLSVLGEKLDKAPIPQNDRYMWKNGKTYLINPTLKKERAHEEDDITIEVAQYLDTLVLQHKVVIYSHIPNETFTKSWKVKQKNTAMGVKSGVPDFIIVLHHHLLFLELKRLKGGVVSEAQKFWLDALSKPMNILTGVAKGFDEAQIIIDSAVNLERVG